ncbi:DUF421 domain-containing protein [Paenibacillus sp. YYML68]|uniref:DUF421 domain-containing protein n=1 Tax=Paenibacillus sp. YYML68 TaxID=2909250 RepID=UPI002492F3FC|nr:DUF421 domain-containing protein [Paenibacillus sp. YYML68]
MEDWLHIAWRSLAAVVILFAITRFLGKKQISQLTFFEYITGIAIGELAGFISTDIEAHFLHGITALSIWFTLPFVMELLTLRSKRLRDFFEGTGTVFIRNGRILERNLRKERYTADELLEQLRTKNVFRVADVEFAVLEASGELSVLQRKEVQPVTPSQLGLETEPERESYTVIMDGVLQEDGLKESPRSSEWLSGELEKLGLQMKDVFLAEVDSGGGLYIDTYEDAVPLQRQSGKAAATSEGDQSADVGQPQMSKPKHVQSQQQLQLQPLQLVLGRLERCAQQLEHGDSAVSQEQRLVYETCSRQLEGLTRELESLVGGSRADEHLHHS